MRTEDVSLASASARFFATANPDKLDALAWLISGLS